MLDAYKICYSETACWKLVFRSRLIFFAPKANDEI